METWSQFLTTALASSTAGLLARLPVHPLDTIKAKLQVKQGTRGIGQVISETVQSEGIKGFYQGIGITAIGSIPAGCLYFCTYEWSKEKLVHSHSLLEQYPSVAHFSAGMFAEFASCVIWVPIDVCKERLQTQASLPRPMKYNGSLDALRTIFRMEGLRGIYKGYGATVASFGPFSAFYLMFYEYFKRSCEEALDTTQLETKYIAFWAATAGALSSWITSPLDKAKLRIQVQRGNKAFTFNYFNVFHGVAQIARTEGLSGLFAGVGPRIAFHAPATALTITLYEAMKRFYNDLLMEE